MLQWIERLRSARLHPCAPSPQSEATVPVPKLSGGSRPALVSFALAVAYGVAAGVILVLGTSLIYAFGAGYFGHFAVPTPFNFVVAPVLLLGLLRVVWELVSRRV